MVEEHQGNSRSGSGAEERTTGTVNVLKQGAPRTREVRTTLGNTMIWSVS